MSWIKQNSNLYTHSDAPFSLQYIGSTWYLVDNRDQSKAIPFSDIFNNPAYPIDLSNQDVLVNSLSSASFVNATHLRSETANTPATPGHSFKAEINSGMYRISSGKIGFSSLGTRVGEFGADYGGFTGNIIQVQNITKSDAYTSLSTSYDPIPGLSISFATKYANSKVLCIGNVKVGVAQDSYPRVALFINGSRFPNTGTSASETNNPSTAEINDFNFSFYYTATSTSSITYDIRILINAGTVYVNRRGVDTIVLTSSSLTLLEVQQ